MGREKTKEGGERRGERSGRKVGPGLNGRELGAKIYGAELGARVTGAELPAMSPSTFASSPEARCQGR